MLVVLVDTVLDLDEVIGPCDHILNWGSLLLQQVHYVCHFFTMRFLHALTFSLICQCRFGSKNAFTLLLPLWTYLAMLWMIYTVVSYKIPFAYPPHLALGTLLPYCSPWEHIQLCCRWYPQLEATRCILLTFSIEGWEFALYREEI